MKKKSIFKVAHEQEVKRSKNKLVRILEVLLLFNTFKNNKPTFEQFTALQNIINYMSERQRGSFKW